MKNDRKNGTEVWVTSIKIDKICDIMSWTSGLNEFINVPQLSKYLSESTKTLYTESPRRYAIGNTKILLVNQRLSVPDLFLGFYNKGSGTENINPSDTKGFGTTLDTRGVGVGPTPRCLITPLT